MNWDILKGKTGWFVVLLIGFLILVSAGFQVAAKGKDGWEWPPKKDSSFDRLRPGIAYHTDSIVFIFRGSDKNGKLVFPSGINQDEWLTLYAQQAGKLLRSPNFLRDVDVNFVQKISDSNKAWILENDFDLFFDKKFVLSGNQSQVCNGSNALVKLKIKSKNVNLTELPSTQEDMERDRDIVKVAQHAANQILLSKGKINNLLAADWISWPLPNGGQIPSPASQQTPADQIDLWARNMAYGTETLEAVSQQYLNDTVIAVVDTGGGSEILIPGPTTKLCNNLIDGSTSCPDTYVEGQKKERFELDLPKGNPGHGTGIEAIISNSKLGVAPGVIVKHIKACGYDNILQGTDCQTENVVQAICLASSGKLNWNEQEIRVPTAKSDDIPGSGSNERYIPKPRVLNLSFGSAFESEIIKQALVDTKNSGILVVAAAGNSLSKVYSQLLMPGYSNPAGDIPIFPAQFASMNPPLLLAVGAVDQSRKYADFSTTNSYVKLAAPGVNVSTAQPKKGPGKTTQYAQYSGTSFAAPYVSGGAALLIAKYRDKKNGQSPSPDQLIQYLVSASSSRPENCPLQCGVLLNISKSLNLVR